MSYKIRYLSSDDFDRLATTNPRYKNIRDSHGFADPQTNTAYVRHTPSLLFNELTAAHEIEHLVNPDDLHMDEFGIMHKKFFRDVATPILKTLGVIAAPFTNGLSLLAAPALDVGYAVAHGDKAIGQVALKSYGINVLGAGGGGALGGGGGTVGGALGAAAGAGSATKLTGGTTQEALANAATAAIGTAAQPTPTPVGSPSNPVPGQPATLPGVNYSPLPVPPGIDPYTTSYANPSGQYLGSSAAAAGAASGLLGSAAAGGAGGAGASGAGAASSSGAAGAASAPVTPTSMIGDLTKGIMDTGHKTITALSDFAKGLLGINSSGAASGTASASAGKAGFGGFGKLTPLLAGAGLLAYSANQKAPEPPPYNEFIPPTQSELTKRLLGDDSVAGAKPLEPITGAGQAASTSLQKFIKSPFGEMFGPPQQDPYVAEAKHQNEINYYGDPATGRTGVRAQVANRWNSMGHYEGRSGQLDALLERMDQEYLRSNNVLDQEAQFRAQEAEKTSRFTAIQQAIGLDESQMRDLLSLANIDVSLAALKYGVEVEDVKQMRDMFAKAGTASIVAGILG